MFGPFSSNLGYFVILIQLCPSLALASGEASMARSMNGLSIFVWFAALNTLIIAAAAIIKRRKAFAPRRVVRSKRPDSDVSFTISNDITETSYLFDRVREFGEDHGLPIHIVFDLCLVMDEMLSYVISNGFAEGQRASIRIHLGIKKEQALFRVEYDGRPLNPLDPPKIDVTMPIEDIPLEGWDIHMLHMLADDIHCESSEGKNTLRVIKRLDNLNKDIGA